MGEEVVLITAIIPVVSTGMEETVVPVIVRGAAGRTEETAETITATSAVGSIVVMGVMAGF
jgi:hypothetical protein